MFRISDIDSVLFRLGIVCYFMCLTHDLRGFDSSNLITPSSYIKYIHELKITETMKEEHFEPVPELFLIFSSDIVCTSEHPGRFIGQYGYFQGLNQMFAWDGSAWKSGDSFLEYPDKKVTETNESLNQETKSIPPLFLIFSSNITSPADYPGSFLGQHGYFHSLNQMFAWDGSAWKEYY